MANYELVVNSKFQPFSFERYIQPYQIYGEAYKELENQYGELATKSNIWEEMANEQTDPYAYKMYKNYANDLKKQADQLAKEGLNASSRKDMLNMRARYAKEITPIEQAYAARLKQAEQQQQALLQDPTLMFSRTAATTSLDDYIRNPQLGYDPYSGKMLTAQVAQAAAALAKEMRDKPRKWNSVLNGQYFETMMKKGYTPEEVLAASLNDPNSPKELRDIVEKAVASSGIASWGDEKLLKRAYEFARQGLPSAIGETQYQTLQNQGYLNPLQRAQLAKLREEQRRETTTPPKTEKGLPIDIHNLNNNNYNESAKQKLYGLLDELGVSRGGINGKYIRSREERRGVRSDLFGAGTAVVKTKDGSDRVRWFNSKGELLSKQYVLAQIDDDTNGQRAIASKYDRIWQDLKQYGLKSSNAKTYTVQDIQKAVQGNINADSNASHTLSAVSLRLSNPSKTLSDKIIPLLLSSDGETLKMKEVKTFHNDGTLDFSKSSIDISDIMDKEGKLRGTPYFFAPPSQEGILTRLNGKMYFIEAKDLGSIGATSNSIDIPRLREAVATRNELIKEYGEEAYYSSETGSEIENVINSSGQSYLKAYIQQLDSEVETPRSKVTD